MRTRDPGRWTGAVLDAGGGGSNRGGGDSGGTGGDSGGDGSGATADAGDGTDAAPRATGDRTRDGWDAGGPGGPAAGADGAGDPLVSVVLPTYGRRPPMFRAAVESVARQTYDPVELVVVDDSPEDVSRPVRTDPPAGLAVRTVREGDHDGAGAARNAGIRTAGGAFVAFIDDDDLWLPGKLSRQVAAFRAAGPEVGVVYTGMQYVRDGEVVGERRATVRGDVTRDVFAGRSLGITSTLMVRASVVPVAGPIDARFPYLEDREWCLRLSRHCEFEVVPDPLVQYRQGDHEQLTDDYEALRDVAYPLFLEKHRPTAAEYGAVWEQKLVAALSRTVAGAALGAGRYADALRFAVRALRHDPTHGRTLAYLLAAAGGPLTYRPLRAVRRTVDRLRRPRSGTGGK